MNHRWLLSTCLVAFASAAASADDPAAPRHGGRILTLGDGAVRVETVHDPAAGTLTLYGVPSAPSTAAVPVSGRMCGGSSARATAASASPTLVLSDGTSMRHLGAVEVAGEPGTWRFVDPALRTTALDARLRISGRDGPLEASWSAAAPSADDASREAGTALPRGPHVLSTTSGRFETTHDAETGTLTVVARTPAQGVLELGKAPVLVLRLADGGERTVALEAVEATPGTWRVRADELKGSMPQGMLKVEIAGRTETVELIGPGDALPTPAAADLSNAPAASAKSSPRSGILLLGKDSAVRLKVATAADGTVTLVPLDSKDVRALRDAAPEIVITGSEGDQTLAAKALGDRSAGWSFEMPAVSRRAEARVRVTVDGERIEAPLVLSDDAAVGLHGGAIASFGDGAARLEVVVDREAGTMLLFAPDATAETRGALKDAPEVSVETKDGAKTLEVEPVADVPGAWRVASPALKEDVVRGTLRVRVSDRTLEAPIPAGRVDLPKPVEPKPADEIGVAPGERR